MLKVHMFMLFVFSSLVFFDLFLMWLLVVKGCIFIVVIVNLFLRWLILRRTYKLNYQIPFTSITNTWHCNICHINRILKLCKSSAYNFISQLEPKNEIYGWQHSWRQAILTFSYPMPLLKSHLKVIIHTPCTDHAWLKVARWDFEETSTLWSQLSDTEFDSPDSTVILAFQTTLITFKHWNTILQIMMMNAKRIIYILNFSFDPESNGDTNAPNGIDPAFFHDQVSWSSFWFQMGWLFICVD